MNVLIVERNTALRRVWVWHLMRQGLKVAHVKDSKAALAYLSHTEVNVIVLNLEMTQERAMSVADYASYRWPDAKVIFVTKDRFFSDGAIFKHCQNACALLPEATNPNDLATMASYYSGQAD
ncbi:MAG: response regulator [Planktomarina sp.]